MGYETRPANLLVFFTTTYRVENGEVSQNNLFGGKTKQVNLLETGVNVQIDRGGFPKNLLKRLFFGVGDVKVSTPAENETYENAFFAGSFMEAVKYEASTLTRQSALEEADKELRSTPLEEFTVGLPAIPSEITDMSYNKSPRTNSNQDIWLVRQGDWIKKDQKIGILGADGRWATIRSPLSGKVEFSCPYIDQPSHGGGVSLEVRPIVNQNAQGNDFAQAAYQEIVSFVQRECPDEPDILKSLTSLRSSTLIKKEAVQSPQVEVEPGA